MATLKQLHIFLAVAETLQMSEAARQLYISQPTVSQTISDLEREFDTALFERQPRFLRLTPGGVLLWEYAQQVVDSYVRLDGVMHSVPATRSLRVGATITIGNTLLSHTVRELHRQCPDIETHLYVENTHLLEERLLHNEVDIALVEGTIVSDKIAKLPLTQDSLKVICSREHPFWERSEIAASDLRNQCFILREEGSGTRAIFENYMRTAKVPIRVVAESSSSTAIIEMVMENLGLGVLSRRCVRRYTTENRIHSCTIQGMPMDRYFYICYHVRRPVTSQMTDFIRVAREVAEESEE